MSALTQLRLNPACCRRDVSRCRWSALRFHFAGLCRAAGPMALEWLCIMAVGFFGALLLAGFFGYIDHLFN
jgi:hypothetical protein